jgi:hypothetical protein
LIPLTTTSLALTAAFYVALEFYILIALFVIFIVAIGFLRRFRGPLARAEGLRNRAPHIGIIRGPDGTVTIERMIEVISGILMSLHPRPLFGRFFISTEGATIRPKTTSPISFIEARSALSANPEVALAGETLLGHLKSAIIGRASQGIANAKDITELLYDFASNYYYPAQSYTLTIPYYTLDQQAKMRTDTPSSYENWKAQYIQDRKNWHLFDIERRNGLSVLNELRNKVRRTKIVLLTDAAHPDGFEVIDDQAKGLIEVKPFVKDVVAERPLLDDEKQRWYESFAKHLADWPDKLPAWVAGREIDFRNIGRWNVESPSADDLAAFENKVLQIYDKTHKSDLIRMMVFFIGGAIIIMAIGATIYLLTK